MEPVSVSAFEDNIIWSRNICCRRTDNRFFFSSDVACKQNIFLTSILSNWKIYKCRTQNMSGIEKFHYDIWWKINFSVIRSGCNLIYGFYAIHFIVQRFPGKFFTFFASLFCKKFCIVSLNSGAVHQNKIYNIARCWSRINVTWKSAFCKNWKKSTMVIMSVRNDYSFKIFQINVEISIFFIRLFAFSLKSAAIHEKFFAVDIKNVFWTSNFLSGS